MQRPISIAWFERCYLGCLVVGLINTAMQWPQMMAKFAENPNTAQLGSNFAPGVAIGTIVLSTAISLLLWYLVTRKRAAVAKWIVTIFFVLGLIGLAMSAMMHTFPTGLAGVLAIVAIVLDALAVWSLFRPDAEAWLGGTPPVESATRL